MDPQKALREAIVTVTVPSALVWGGLAIMYRGNMATDEWPLWVLFFALPLPLIFPVYKRYRSERPAVSATRFTVFSMVADFLVSAIYIFAAFQRWRPWDSQLQLFLAAVWFLLGLEYLSRVRRSRTQPTQ
jgi:FtsH-binding integral membrane protein